MTRSGGPLFLSWWVWALVLSSLPHSAAAAQDGAAADLTIERVEVGIGGYYKLGRWAPLTVTVSCTRPMRVQLTSEALDPDGSPTLLSSTPVDLPLAGSHRLRGYFRSGRLNAPLRVRVREGSQPPITRQLRVSDRADAQFRPALTQSVLLVATLGQPAGFDENEIFRVAELKDAEQLPEEVTGYDALNALVIAGPYDLDRKRNDAIRDWVRLGGHLVISVGSEVEAYRLSPLAKWIPVPIRGQFRLRELSGMETFADNSTRIPIPVGVRTIQAARIGPIDGQVLIGSLNGPLLIRVPFGFGQVTVLGIDLNRPPLSIWKPIASIAEKIIAGRRPLMQQSTQRGHLSHAGISELATQLHAAQELFPQVHRLSTWMLMSLLLIYLIVIGPVDYLLVHRLLKKPQLTWFTFPTMVVIAGVLAAWGARASNGNQLRVNQIDVIDIDAVERDARPQLVRGKTWVNVYSPQSQRYQVEIEPVDLPRTRPSDASAMRPRIAWNGIPERVSGGMYRPGGFEIARPEYTFTARATGIKNLPIAIWSTKGLTASWQQQADSLVESKLVSTAVGQLKGSIVHHLPAPLEDWILAYGRRVYRPVSRSNAPAPVLKPGQVLSPHNTSSVRDRELKGFLTGARARSYAKGTTGGVGIFQEQAIYDPLNRDPDQIMQMLTFHQIAGGKEYTGLDNDALSTLDLSDLVHLNRAVLFGKIGKPAAILKLNGESVEPSRHSVYVRIVLPVKLSRTILKALPTYNAGD